MITQLNDISQIWWQWMGSMFWQVSLLIILITCLDIIIRKWAWPQVRYALWAMVFIKLIIPPAWEMPTSIVSWIQPQVEEQITIQVGMTEDIEKGSVSYFTPGEQSDSVSIEHTTWKVYALLAWVSGMLIFSLMLLRKMLQFRKWHQSHIKSDVPEWFNELMVKTARQLKLKKNPSVVFSKDTKSPAVYGVFRSVLLLPDGYLDHLSRKQAEHILLHEFCHLKRGDILVHWLCVSLQIVYWFNPLLIWTRRQMRNICEICCDLSVANVLREKTVYYRDTLLRTARELFSETMEPSLGFLGIFEEPFRLVPRLKWLEKKTWENRSLKAASIICISFFMIACVMPMAKNSQPGTQENTDIDKPNIDLVAADTGEVESEPGALHSDSVLYDLLLIEKDKDKNLDFSGVYSKINNTGDSGAVIDFFAKSDASYSDLKKEIEAELDIKIISSPRVIALKGKTAELKIGGSGTGELSITILPQKIEKDTVQQNIKVMTKEVDNESEEGFRERSFENNIIVKSGSTIVIGGIPGEHVHTVNNDKKELCVLITPSIDPAFLSAQSGFQAHGNGFISGKSIGSEKVFISDNNSNTSVLLDQAWRLIRLQQIDLDIEKNKSQLAEINEQLKHYEGLVEGTPVIEQGLLNLTKEYSSQKALYNAMMERKIKAEISTSVERKKIQDKIKEIEPYGKKVNMTSSFLNDEVENIRKHLENKEKEIKAYKDNHTNESQEDYEYNIAILNSDYETIKNRYNSLLDKKLEAEKAVSIERKKREEMAASLKKAEQQTPAVSNYLNNELDKIHTSLVEKEKQIKEYREKYHGKLPSQLQVNLINLEKLSVKRDELSIRLNERLTNSSALLKQISTSKAPKDTDEMLAALKKELFDLMESKEASKRKKDVNKLTSVIIKLEAVN